MPFEIPPQFRATPEAKRLEELWEMQKAVGRESNEASKQRMWETDPKRFEAIAERSRALRLEEELAEKAFDEATGGPQPAELPPRVLDAIDKDFPEPDRAEVAAKLAKAARWFARHGGDPGVFTLLYVVLLARGDRSRFDEYLRMFKGEGEVGDYRDILVRGREAFPEAAEAENEEAAERWKREQARRAAAATAAAEEAAAAKPTQGADEAPPSRRPWWRFW